MKSEELAAPGSHRKLRTIEMNRISVEEFREAEKLPLIVVLDDVRSMYNIGSVFRTCDAFRVEAIYLCGITACPPHQEIHKTALGAEDSVAWRYFETAEQAVEQLNTHPQSLPRGTHPQSLPKGGKSDVICAPKNNENPSLREGHRVGVIFGNEVKGVHQEVIDMSDGCLEIPQFGTKHSMNVSVTAGIVIWEFARRFLLSAE